MKAMAGLILLLSTGAAWGAEAYGSKPEVYSILVDESFRPESAAPRGSAVLDLAESAVARVRKARKILEDAKVWSTGTERPQKDWADAADRLARVEAAYKGSVFPGLDALGVGLIRTRETTVNTDIQLKERELFAKLDKDGGPKSAMGLGPENPLGLRPAKQSLASLTARRQAGVASLLQAEELLDRAMAKLKDVPAAPSRYWYLADLVTEAQDAVRQAAEKGLAVAKAEEAVARDKGACWEAIRALEAYGGAEGKGSFDDASRLNAINLSNAAKRKHVENEYQYASRVEEARTWDYMLDLFAKL